VSATVEFVRAWQSTAGNARCDQTGANRLTQTGAVRHVQASVFAAGGAVASVSAVVSHGSSVTLVSAGVATVRGVS